MRNSGIKEKILRKSILKSSLFSARIEGNTLHLNTLNAQDDSNEDKNEVLRIFKAVKYLQQKIRYGDNISVELLFLLHSLVMTGKAGLTLGFRKEMGAIFNQSGVAVYVSPPPTQIKELINKLIVYVHSGEEQFPLILAFVAHLIFEKIHPFVDGNGRVGRLLIFAILKMQIKEDLMYIPYEEYLDNHKDDYYYHLDTGLKDVEKYLVFMLSAFYEQTKKVLEETEIINNENIPLLPPRQEEIYLLIKDHRMISFETIRWRFLKIPERTLRYDLKKLADKELIIKIGETRGSFYAVKKE